MPADLAPSGPVQVGSGEGRTFPALLRSRAAADPGGTAYVEKRLGIWRPVTWRSFADDVASFAHALSSLGVVKGDGVAIMAKPCSEWLVADLAAQSIGAVSMGFYVTTPAGELRRIVDAVGPKILVLENDEYLDRFVGDTGGAPGGPSIVRLSGPATVGQSFADLAAEGSAKRLGDPGGWDRWVDARTGDEPVVGFVSSGTTRPARVAVHTPRGLIDVWRSVADAYPIGASGRRQRTVADAQMAHPVGRSLALYLPLIAGSLTYIPDTEETGDSAAIEVRPTWAYVRPARLSALRSRIDTALARSGRFRRGVVRAASRLRGVAVDRESNGDQIGLAARAMSALGYVTACRQILDRFGMVATRVAFVGGSPVDRDLLRGWRVLGLPVRRIYSLAEAVVVGFESTPDLEGWLTTPSNVEVRIAEGGELEVTGSGVCVGYFEGGDVRGTSSSWLGTEDMAVLGSDGRVRLIDRVADALSVGDQTVYRTVVESLFDDAPHIRNVHVFEGRPGHLAALIELDAELVNIWASDAGRRVTALAALATDPEVHALIAGHVDRVNRRLAARGLLTVDDFRVLPSELDPEDGDAMTPTGSLRRAALEAQFDSLVTELRGQPTLPHGRQQAAHGVR